ncbi:uncharacterized protein [Vulpes vulpes]|uniref:Uncharacterized protein n=1 Tax=Vulpes vulpes TaxID=9627 RepID=A0ABM5AVJ4_VULVU
MFVLLRALFPLEVAGCHMAPPELLRARERENPTSSLGGDRHPEAGERSPGSAPRPGFAADREPGGGGGSARGRGACVLEAESAWALGPPAAAASRGARDAAGAAGAGAGAPGGPRGCEPPRRAPRWGPERPAPPRPAAGSRGPAAGRVSRLTRAGGVAGVRWAFLFRRKIKTLRPTPPGLYTDSARSEAEGRKMEKTKVLRDGTE